MHHTIKSIEWNRNKHSTVYVDYTTHIYDNIHTYIPVTVWERHNIIWRPLAHHQNWSNDVNFCCYGADVYSADLIVCPHTACPFADRSSAFIYTRDVYARCARWLWLRLPTRSHTHMSVCRNSVPIVAYSLSYNSHMKIMPAMWKDNNIEDAICFYS